MIILKGMGINDVKKTDLFVGVLQTMQCAADTPEGCLNRPDYWTCGLGLLLVEDDHL